jgi:hypothetical protein
MAVQMAAMNAAGTRTHHANRAALGAGVMLFQALSVLEAAIAVDSPHFTPRTARTVFHHGGA